MAKSRRLHRKSHKGHKGRKGHKKMRTHRKQRGGDRLEGAPLSYSLAGDWSSKMSLGQGEDFFKYHANQHGGAAPYPMSVDGNLLPTAMVGPSMSSGYYQAINDVAGLKDAMPTPNIPMPGVSAAPGAQSGGRKRRGRKSKKSKRHGKKRHCRSRKQRGGATLGFDSVSAPGLLLPTQSMYNQAGLNPQYYLGTSAEQMDATRRDME